MDIYTYIYIYFDVISKNLCLTQDYKNFLLILLQVLWFQLCQFTFKLFSCLVFSLCVTCFGLCVLLALTLLSPPLLSALTTVRTFFLLAVLGLGCFAWAPLVAVHSSSCGVWASVVAVCGLSNWSTPAQLLCGMWDLPGPGIKPVSPALAGRLLTTGPPGNSCCKEIEAQRM